MQQGHSLFIISPKMTAQILAERTFTLFTSQKKSFVMDYVDLVCLYLDYVIMLLNMEQMIKQCTNIFTCNLVIGIKKIRIRMKKTLEHSILLTFFCIIGIFLLTELEKHRYQL